VQEAFQLAEKMGKKNYIEVYASHGLPIGSNPKKLSF